MNKARYQSEKMVELFKRRTIASLPQLKEALGGGSDMTVIRKLKELDCISSYSHGGGRYALAEDAKWSEHGLWSHDSVRFSRHGNLLRTAEVFVSKSKAGYFASELDSILGVTTKEALLKLYRRSKVHRERVSGRYLYCSSDSGTRRVQLMSRRIQDSEQGLVPGIASDGVVPDDVKSSLSLFISQLDEKQRRLFAGLESLKLGHGGDRRIAGLTGLDVHTVARGRAELLSGEIETQRVRKVGGGRKPVEKKRLR